MRMVAGRGLIDIKSGAMYVSGVVSMRGLSQRPVTEKSFVIIASIKSLIFCEN